MAQNFFSFHPGSSCSQSVLATDHDRGEIFCEGCGLVIVEKLVDNIHDKHTFSKQQYLDRTRVEGESKLSFHDMGLSTKISLSSKDAEGRFIPSKTKQRFRRLRTWDSRSKSRGRERSMITAFTYLNTITSKLGLPEATTEKAAYLYRKAAEKKLIRGRTIKAMISASLYAACRESETPRSLDDFAKAANIRRTMLSSSYRHLFRNLELESIPHDPKNDVNRISTAVNANEQSKRLAYKILDLAKKYSLITGKKPLGIAGAAVYLAVAINNQKVTYSQLSKNTHVSAVTMRKMVRYLVKNIDDLDELSEVAFK